MALLEVRDVCRCFESQDAKGRETGDRPALDHVSLSLESGSILCLLGPSGCGKTTLLRIIAGLEKADQGRILFDGADMADIPPHRRQFGMMFQEFALFPHKNVSENVAFGLEMRKLSSGEISRRTDEMLELVGLGGFATRDVSRLSGGERQRVALARSLAPNPRLLMLDEPLGSLDRALRERLMLDLRRILKKLGATAIFVTHDQTEAFTVADMIAVFDQGRVIRTAPPETLYQDPADPIVARFLGFHNLLEGQVTADGRISTAIGILRSASAMGMPPGQEVSVLLRPEALQVENEETHVPDCKMLISGSVSDRIFQGRNYRVTIQSKAGPLIFDLPSDSPRPATDHPLCLMCKFQVLPGSKA